MNQQPSALIRYPILSILFAVAWIAGCLFVWYRPTTVCLARPTPTPSPTSTASTPEPSSAAAQAAQTPTPVPKTCNPVLLRVLPPTAGPTQTPTPDPRSTVERLLADLGLAGRVAGYRILSVQAIGPLDWVETGTTKLVLVPTTLPTPSAAEQRTTATPTPTSPASGAASESLRENNAEIDAVILRIDQPGANGLIPLLIAVDEKSFVEVRNLIGRSVVYPVHAVPTPAP